MKHWVGHGPLTARLTGLPARPRLELDDAEGLVETLPVHHAEVPRVQNLLGHPGPARNCLLEVLAPDGTLITRWGTFAAAGYAAALGVALLASDRHSGSARVVATGHDHGTEITSLTRSPQSPVPW